LFIFHSFLFFLISFFFPFSYASALFLGYLAHILADGLTVQGVQLFYPFSSYKTRGPVRVGGLMEEIILLVLVFLIIESLF